MSGSKKAKAGQGLRDIDQPIYRYYQALFLSFFSGNLYVDIGKRWKGYGLTYLLFLVAILTLPYALIMSYDFNTFYQDEFIDPLNKLPKIYIQNGKVDFDKPMPYYVKSKTGKRVLAVDTTGELQSIDAKTPDLMMLIQRDQILFRLPTPQYLLNKSHHNSNKTVYAQQFDSHVNEVFTGATWIKSSGIYRIKWLAISLLYPLVLSAFYFSLVVASLCFAFLAQLVGKVFLRFALTYKQAYRLLITSSTPGLMLLFLSLLINYKPPFFGGFLFLVIFLYFSYAVFNLKRESSKLARL